MGETYQVEKTYKIIGFYYFNIIQRSYSRSWKNMSSGRGENSKVNAEKKTQKKTGSGLTVYNSTSDQPWEQNGIKK